MFLRHLVVIKMTSTLYAPPIIVFYLRIITMKLLNWFHLFEIIEFLSYSTSVFGNHGNNLFSFSISWPNVIIQYYILSLNIPISVCNSAMCIDRIQIDEGILNLSDASFYYSAFHNPRYAYPSC